MKFYMIESSFIQTLLFVFAALRYAQGFPCMTPDDARLITSLYNISEWFNNSRWNTGPYLSTDTKREQDSRKYLYQRGVIFTANGTNIWWLKNSESGGLYLITQDKSKLLCASRERGLQVKWHPNNPVNRYEYWCQWNISASDDGTMFRFKSFQNLDMMKKVGDVYLDQSGLFFDYDESTTNDRNNAIEEERKWFVWVKSRSEQRDMDTIEESCHDEFIKEMISEVSAVNARSTGRRRVAKQLKTLNELVVCSSGWYLFGGSCYKALSNLLLTQSQGKQICQLLGGTLVVPRSKLEQSFLNRLFRLVGPQESYWLGLEKRGDHRRFHDMNGNAITFRRWSKGSRISIFSDNCAFWRRRRWFPANCESLQNLLCKKSAVMRSPTMCGKIQEKDVDNFMQSASEVTEVSHRIVNGITAEMGQFPWQAAIRYKEPIIVDGIEVVHNCGGALIDKCWVVTAAHCVLERNEDLITVRLGDFNNKIAEATEQELEAERIIIHEEFSLYPSPRFDIALIKLKRVNGRCARFGKFVQPACLPDPSSNVMDGKRCQVSGWGVTNYTLGLTTSSANLQWTTLPKLADEYCESKYNTKTELFIRNTMFCAGLKEGGRDACTGDSGGPYVCRKNDGSYELSGIVSFGVGCAQSQYPGVYVRVSYFVPWISNKIR